MYILLPAWIPFCLGLNQSHLFSLLNPTLFSLFFQPQHPSCQWHQAPTERASLGMVVHFSQDMVCAFFHNTAQMAQWCSNFIHVLLDILWISYGYVGYVSDSSCTMPCWDHLRPSPHGESRTILRQSHIFGLGFWREKYQETIFMWYTSHGYTTWATGIEGWWRWWRLKMMLNKS